MVIFKRLLYSIIFTSMYVSCDRAKDRENWRHIEISPLNNTQVITIITKENKRYFMNGSHKEVPDDNYMLLDISKVDRLGDGFSICWNDKGYKWKLASSYASLIENKLDTTQFIYYQPKEEFDKPLSIEYKDKNCGNFLIRETRSPWGNLKIKYISY